MEIEREDYPARSAAERVPRALEFGLPLLVTAEGFFDRLQGVAGGLAVAAEIGEVDFVQYERACPDQFLAFEVAVNVSGQVFVLQHRVEALLDGVESAHSAAVVVLVMRPNEFFRNPFELGRIERQRLDLMLPAKGLRGGRRGRRLRSRRLRIGNGRQR